MNPLNTQLSARLQQPDMLDLDEAEAAAVLNALDPELPLVPMTFNCRTVAKPAVLSGELGMLKVVAEANAIPADISPTGQLIPIPSVAMAAIETLLDAIERDLEVDPSQPGEMLQVSDLLDGIEALGLLSATTKAAILAGTVRQQSWAEKNGFPNGVTSGDVGHARGHE
jgi:hypothetical protein